MFSPSQDLHHHIGNFHFFVVVANTKDLNAAGSTHTHRGVCGGGGVGGVERQRQRENER